MSKTFVATMTTPGQDCSISFHYVFIHHISRTLKIQSFIAAILK
jgi:hypothetical protein